MRGLGGRRRQVRSEELDRVGTPRRGTSDELAGALRNMFLSGLTIGVLNFAVQIWFARTLGIHVIADYGRIAVFVGLVGIATSIGINQAVIGLGFTQQRRDNALTISLILGAIVIALAVIGGFALCVVTPRDVNRLWRPAILSVLGVVLILPANALTSGPESRLEYGKLALLRVGAFASANVGAIAVCLFRPGVAAMVSRDFLNALFYLISALTVACCAGPVRLRLDSKVVWPMLSFSRNVWLASVSTEGSRRLDLAMVSILLGTRQFGIYFQTRNLVDGSLGFITYPIQSAVFSYLSKHRDNVNFNTIRAALFSCAVIAGLGGFLLFYFFGTALISVLLGKAWGRGGRLLAPLAVYAAISVYFEIQVSMAKAQGNMRTVLLSRMVSMIGTIILIPTLCLALGIVGAAYGTLAVSVLLLISAETLSRRYGRSIASDAYSTKPFE